MLSQCAYYEWDARSAEQMTECVARLVSDVPVRQHGLLPDATAPSETLRGKIEEVSDMEQMSTEPRLSAYLHARACANGHAACGKL
ncbi:MAG: hypothetical protein ACLUNO_01790 [Oscillospiraceae bacterium]